MNWTGGRLQRHSGKWSKNSALTSRQKEHFAKVQTKLRSSSHKNSPTKWSIFDRIQLDPLGKQDSHNHNNSRRNVEKVSNPTEGELRRVQSSRSQRSDEERRSTSRQTRTRSGQKSERCPSVATIHGRSISDDDLYNATPPPQRVKHEHARSGKPPLSTGSGPSKRVPPEPADDSMDVKRRRLLLKVDWIGLSARRPPPLKFVPTRHDEEIGRRRKLTDGHRARYARQQAVISSPFVTRRAQNMETRYEGALRNDVRISIGDRVVPPDHSSSFQSTQYISSTPRSLLARKRQTLSPDEMLLDNDSLIRDRDNIDSDKFLRAFEAASFQNAKDRGFANHNGVYYDAKPRVIRGENVTQHTKPTRYTPNRNTTSDEPESVASSFSRTAVRSVCDAGVKQPIPRRHHKHPVLHLSSPQGNSSVMARVGQPRPVVPEDQLLDNEAWKSWIAPLAKTPTHSERNLLGLDASISPGVSAVPPHHLQASRASSLEYEYDEQRHALSWETEDQEESVKYGTMVVDEGGRYSPLRDRTNSRTEGHGGLHHHRPSPNDQGTSTLASYTILASYSQTNR
jgi:hypothetical protein